MGIMRLGKAITNKYPKLMFFLTSVYNFLPFNNHIKKCGVNNKINIDKSILTRCNLQIKGNNNKIIIGENCILKKSNLCITGNNNTIIIEKKVYIDSGEFWIENENNKIFIDEHTFIAGKTHLACIEGCSINIGKDCLFSSDVVFRTGDSHSILDMKGKRINPSNDINIKNHVWIGNKTTITKGVAIMQDSVIATGAIVTKSIDKPNVVIGGIPAKIIKENINWSKERIPFVNTGE